MSAPDPLTLLKTFAEFVGIGLDLVHDFAAEHPELIEPPDPEAPPEAPTGDIDPAVLADIQDQKL